MRDRFADEVSLVHGISELESKCTTAVDGNCGHDAFASSLSLGTGIEKFAELLGAKHRVDTNHEQFGDDSKFVNAVAAAGVRVLSNEKVEVDSLQIIGIPYQNAVHHGRFASVLHAIELDRDRASILLPHAPDYPGIAETAGVSLQLWGATHLGSSYLGVGWRVTLTANLSMA